MPTATSWATRSPKLAREDPTFRAFTDDETGETIISGMGELHLEVLCSRLQTEYQVQCQTGKPKVAYRQTLARDADVEGRHIKQSGGRGQYGVVKVRAHVTEETENTFESKVVGGNVPKEYIPAVEQGLLARRRAGRSPRASRSSSSTSSSTTARPTTSTRPRWPSSEAGRLAFKESVDEGGYDAPRAVDADRGHGARGEPGRRAGQPEPATRTDRADGEGRRRRQSASYGAVPLAEMFRYSETLRGLTQGRGIYTMEPLEYRPVPESIAEEVRKEVLAAKEAKRKKK